jgi:hypothetical protein
MSSSEIDRFIVFILKPFAEPTCNMPPAINKERRSRLR